MVIYSPPQFFQVFPANVRSEITKTAAPQIYTTFGLAPTSLQV